MIYRISCRINPEKSCESCLNDRAVRNHGVLGDDDNAVADEVGTAWSICFDDARCIQQPGVLSDARILIDDGVLDDGFLTDSNARQILTQVGPHVFQRLIEIRAHDERRIDLHSFRNPAAHANHGVRYLSAVHDAAIADDRIVDLALFDLRRRQVARAREHRCFGVEQIEFRNLARQIEIGAIESADSSDVFPVAVEHVCLNVSRSYGRWYHMLAEIDPRGIFGKQLFELRILENVNSHRREKRPALCFLRIESELSCIDLHREQLFTFRFLFELDDASRLIRLQQTKLTRRTRLAWDHRNSYISIRLMMAFE